MFDVYRSERKIGDYFYSLTHDEFNEMHAAMYATPQSRLCHEAWGRLNSSPLTEERGAQLSVEFHEAVQAFQKISQAWYAENIVPRIEAEKLIREKEYQERVSGRDKKIAAIE